MNIIYFGIKFNRKIDRDLVLLAEKIRDEGL